jgi:excisionase family DNA binding protein
MPLAIIVNQGVTMMEFDSLSLAVHSDGTMPETFYSVNEVAELKGWTRQWVAKLIKQGRLEAVRMGREWRIPASALENIKDVPMGRPRKSGRPNKPKSAQK